MQCSTFARRFGKFFFCTRTRQEQGPQGEWDVVWIRAACRMRYQQYPSHNHRKIHRATVAKEATVLLNEMRRSKLLSSMLYSLPLVLDLHLVDLQELSAVAFGLPIVGAAETCNTPQHCFTSDTLTIAHMQPQAVAQDCHGNNC